MRNVIMITNLHDNLFRTVCVCFNIILVTTIVSNFLHGKVPTTFNDIQAKNQ